MTMTLATLHPDILQEVEESGRKPVEVIDPSPGLWGGEPIPELVTVVYECNCESEYKIGEHSPTHHMLFGPRILRFSDTCVCGLGKYRKHINHEYEPGYCEVTMPDTYVLYAD
jgi:hypothetical protein